MYFPELYLKNHRLVTIKYTLVFEVNKYYRLWNYVLVVVLLYYYLRMGKKQWRMQQNGSLEKEVCRVGGGGVNQSYKVKPPPCRCIC